MCCGYMRSDQLSYAPGDAPIMIANHTATAAIIGQAETKVVAAQDHRTTDCYLRAHAQIVPFDGKFHLTGTPRFADYLEWTPFHNRCRSSVVLYLAMYDDGFTDKMRVGSYGYLKSGA